MAGNSKIEWTQKTWNPVTGCDKVSQGCKHCYADRLARRLQAMGNARYRNGFEVTLHEDLLDKPFEWKQPQLIFVNSMSDLFHEKIPMEFIQRVFYTMVECPQHVFQILTKRNKQLSSLAPELPWAENIWMGVSVENADVVDRVRDLQEIPARVKFLSCEPLIGPIPELPLEGIDWVIVGGESGPGARPMDLNWARQIRDQCQEAGVAFFLKQLGGQRNKHGGEDAVLDGKQWLQFPSLMKDERVATANT